MDFLTRFGLEKSRLTILVMLGLLVVGILTYTNLPKREDPAITVRSVVVSASFAGLSPERIEDLLAIPIERKAREIGEVEDINSLITTGSAVVTLQIGDGVPVADLERVFQDIRNRMDELRLPEGTDGPNVNTNYGDVAIATIAVTGDGFSYAEIFDAAEELQTHLYKIDGITKVSISGRQEERIFLEIDSRKLAAVGVQLQTVIDDLKAQNVILPAGSLDAGGVSLALEANGDFNSVEEIGQILTQITGTTNLVQMKDLLTVRRGYVDPPEQPIYFNGQPALVLAVEMEASQDIQKLGRTLKAAVERFEYTQPIGISYQFSTYQEANVTASINNALQNVAQTFLVVLLVLLVFLGLRPAFAVAMIVPFTVMIGLLGMQYMGIALEQISIAAVIISLGLLVDNGVVVVEDIQTRIRRGENPHEAAMVTGRQFAIPLAVASVTTVAAFIPMLILDGTEGEFAFSLGAVVAIMLAGSWVTALYILPFLAASVISKSENRDETRLMQLYGFVVSKIRPFSLVVVVAVYAVVALGGTFFGAVKSQFFPLSERAEYLIYLDMPKGTTITATRDEALSLNAWIMDQPEVKDTTVFVGSGGPRVYLALDPADTDPSSAFILVNTHDRFGALATEARTRNHVMLNHPAARFRVARLSMGGSESGIVTIEITGDDGETMLEAAKALEARYATAPGIQYYQNDWGNKVVKLIVQIQQDKAREFGVSSSTISDLLETYFNGSTESTYREGSDSIPIVLRADENFRDSLEDLANLSIPANGRLIALDQVATFAPRFEFSQIRRENQERRIVVEGKSGTLTAAGLFAHVEPAFADVSETLGSAFQVQMGGELADSAETNATLAAGLPITLIVMLAALTFQFNSVRRVLLTFATIPLIVAGAAVGLLILGQPLSFFGILGMFALMGIIINNAIVLIDQIDIERQSLGLEQAIVTAAKKRVTPITLTTATTVLGLVPMAVAGGALFEPMATLMIGGLLLASILALFLVPCGYYLLFWTDRTRTSPSTNSPD